MVLYVKRRQEGKVKVRENNIPKVKSDFFEPNDLSPVKTISSIQSDYFKKALDIAILSNLSHKHGALLIHKNKIISIGYNYFEPYLNKSLSIHAEVACILNIKKSARNILNECEMYVIRLSPIKGVCKYSKPCDNCMNFINKYNIRKVYYSTNYEYDDLTDF
jgi:deoxycytidylate deaminase